MKTFNAEILIKQLTSCGSECEWIEFKKDCIAHDKIGENISAISNSVTLHHKEGGYIIWGVSDLDKNIIGTTFKPRSFKVGNEELENWLIRLMTPRIDFRIHEFVVENQPVVIFEIPPAQSTPVRFRGEGFIRIGSYTKKLKAHPEKERALWAALSECKFETGIAASNVAAEEVLSQLDCKKYFELIHQKMPENDSAKLDRLEKEGIAHKIAEGIFDVTNLGAVLFAANMRLLQN